jgi:hypothetical protein
MPKTKSTVKATLRTSQSSPTSRRWWTVLFWIPVPDRQNILSWMNVLLLHKVVGPSLRKRINEVDLYRFHCVYNGNQEDGHEWKFLFYSTAKVADSIFRSIRANRLLAKLKTRNLVRKVDYDSLHDVHHPDIKDRSWHEWHLFIQEAWPYYAKGVSECWWMLVEKFAADLESKVAGTVDFNNLDHLSSFYRKVNEKIGVQWRDHGQHIFIHHLHAIISWEPIAITPRWRFELTGF